MAYSTLCALYDSHSTAFDPCPPQIVHRHACNSSAIPPIVAHLSQMIAHLCLDHFPPRRHTVDDGVVVCVV